MYATRRQLGAIATIFAGMPTKQSQLRACGPSGNVLTVRGLGEFGIDRRQLVDVDLNSRDVNKYRAKKNDLLLSSRSTSLKLAVVPEELDGIIVNATLIGVRSLPALDPRLLAAYLSHPEGQAALEVVAQSATIQMNLTVNALQGLEVPVPSAVDQRRLVELLNASDTAFESAVQSAQLRRQLATHFVVDQLKESRTP